VAARGRRRLALGAEVVRHLARSRTRARPACRSPHHGCGAHPRERRGLFRPPIRREAIRVDPVAAPVEQPSHAAPNRFQHGFDIGAGNGSRLVKRRAIRRPGREDAVQHQRVHVNVQVERAAEALHDGHASTTAIRDARPTRLGAQRTLDRVHEDRDNRATEVVVPRELIPKPVRQAEHPLSHGHIRKDPINQMCCALRHPAAAAARTEAAPLARERHEAILPARRAPEAREPARQPPAPQERAKLLLDKSRQPFALAQTRSLPPERLEVIADDLVERAFARAPGLVLERWPGHARATSQSMPRPPERNQAARRKRLSSAIGNCHVTNTAARRIRTGGRLDQQAAHAMLLFKDVNAR